MSCREHFKIWNEITCLLFFILLCCSLPIISVLRMTLIGHVLTSAAVHIVWYEFFSSSDGLGRCTTAACRRYSTQGNRIHLSIRLVHALYRRWRFLNDVNTFRTVRRRGGYNVIIDFVGIFLYRVSSTRCGIFSNVWAQTSIFEWLMSDGAQVRNASLDLRYHIRYWVATFRFFFSFIVRISHIGDVAAELFARVQGRSKIIMIFYVRLI